MNTHVMEKLEQLLGTRHILVDDWNALGWEFADLPLMNQRVLVLVNYTECKAEGGKTMCYIETIMHQTAEGTWEDKRDQIKVVTIISEGSGPHGIPWYDGLAPYSGEMLWNGSVEDFAANIKSCCAQEGESHYWDPWRDEHPKKTLLFEDIEYGSTERKLVEIKHVWREQDWEESVMRAMEEPQV